MNPIRVAVIQATYDSAPDAMARKLTTMTADAAKAGARIVILPELSLTPYFPLTAIGDQATEPLPENIPNGPSCRLFADLARDNGIFIVGSLYERGGLGFRKQKGARYCTTIAFDPEGRPGAACRRQHLATGSTHDADYFQAGNSDYPVFGLPDVRVAMPSGHDLWFPEMARIYAMKGAELIAAPCATRADGGQDTIVHDAWLAMLRSHAVANGIYVAVVNRTGTEADTTFLGGSVIIAPDGTLLAQADADEGVHVAEIASEAIASWRDRHAFLLEREPETYSFLLGRLTRKEPDSGSAP